MKRLPGILGLVALLSGLATAGAWATTPLFLDDWGITYLQWTPNASAPPNLNYWVEDYVSGGGGWLGPGDGGQDYDIEAMYLGWDASKYYIGIVTGFPIDGEDGLQRKLHAALTIRATSPSMSRAITSMTSRSTSARAASSAPAIWRGRTPTSRVSPAWGGAADPLRVTSWSNSSPIDAFRYDTFSGRYRSRRSSTATRLGPVNSVFAHWTMGCGNDLGESAVAVTPVPEPASIFLLGGGLAAAGVLFGRRKKS